MLKALQNIVAETNIVFKAHEIMDNDLIVYANNTCVQQ